MSVVGCGGGGGGDDDDGWMDGWMDDNAASCVL